MVIKIYVMKNLFIYLIAIFLFTSFASSAQLKDNKQYGLIWLYKNGYVRIKGTGQSITEIYPVVQNLVNHSIKVVVSPGTYFHSGDEYQNMVTRKQYTFTLGPLATKRLHIEATCINADLEIPDGSAKFNEIDSVPDNLVAFLKACSKCNQMVVQAGTWAITDDYTGEDVQNHLAKV